MAKARGNGEGSVYKVEKPSRVPGEPTAVRWVAQVRQDGQKRRRSAPTEAKAKKLLREMLTETDAGTLPADGNLTVANVIDRWQAKVLPASSLSPRTLDGYAWACDILRADLGTRRLSTLHEEDVEAAFEARAAAGLSRASLVKVRSVLGKVLDYARRRRMTVHNIAQNVELPAGARRTEEGRSMTVDQARTLLDADHRLHALWAVMLYLGLRPGEATGLTWADIDTKRNVVHVRRSLKLERGVLVLDERLKTDRSRRSLEAPAPVMEALKAHRKAQAAAQLKAGELWQPPYPDLVFTTALGTPLGPRNVHRSLSLLTERLGLGPWHPHELRHTAASLMSAAGIPMERIADQLGHDGTRMGLLVYRHQTKPTVDGGLAMGSVLSE